MAIDITVNNDPSTAHVVVGLLVVVAFWLLVVALIRRRSVGGLTRPEKERFGDIRAQLANLNGSTVTLPDSVAGHVASRRSTIRNALTPGSTSEDGLRTALQEVRAAWRERTDPIPRLALAAGYESLALLVLVGIVTVPTAVIVEWLHTDDGLSLADVIAVGTDAWDTLLAALALFPASDIVWSLLLTGVIMGYELLYEFAAPVAIILGAGAVAITLLDRRTDGRLRSTLYPRKRAMVGYALASGIAIWAAGSIPAWIARVAGFPQVGAVAGGVIALLLLVAFAGIAGKDLVVRLRQRYDELYAGQVATPFGPDASGGVSDSRTLVLGYLLTRKGLAGLIIAMLPVAGWYAVEAIASGALVEKLMAFAQASILTKLALLAVVLGVLSMVVQLNASEWQEVAAAAMAAATTRAVQAALFVRAAPYLIAGAVLVIALSFGVSIPGAFLAAGAVGVTSQKVAKQGRTLGYRIRQNESEPFKPPFISIAGGTVDVDGDTIYVLRVQTHWLAWPDQEVLVDQAVTVAEALFDGENPPPSKEHNYYEHLTDTGEHDVQSFLDARITEAKHDWKHLVKPDGEDIEVVEDYLDSRYDDDIISVAEKRCITDPTQGLAGSAPISRGDHRYHWHGGMDSD